MRVLMYACFLPGVVTGSWTFLAPSALKTLATLQRVYNSRPHHVQAAA